MMRNDTFNGNKSNSIPTHTTTMPDFVVSYLPYLSISFNNYSELNTH